MRKYHLHRLAIQGSIMARHAGRRLFAGVLLRGGNDMTTKNGLLIAVALLLHPLEALASGSINLTDFTSAVDSQRQAYHRGTTELKKAQARTKRAELLCALGSGDVRGWTGQVLSANFSGKGHAGLR
jgi:hypothetical protein